MVIKPKGKVSKNGKYKKTKLTNTIKGILFVSPWLIGFAVFTLIPFINGILYSFNAVSITPGKIKSVLFGNDDMLCDAGYIGICIDSSGDA